MVGLGLAQWTITCSAVVIINVHWLPGILVDLENAIHASKVFVEPVDVFLELIIEGDLPCHWPLSEHGQHPVKEPPGCLAVLSHMKDLAKQHAELMQVCRHLVAPLIH